MQKTIAFDFDGVINTYEKGWNNGVDNITGVIREVVANMRMCKDLGFKIVIFTTRANNEIHKKECEKFLLDNNIPFDVITDRKEPWIVLVDDRAINFNQNRDTYYSLLKKLSCFDDKIKEVFDCTEAPCGTDGASIEIYKK